MITFFDVPSKLPGKAWSSTNWRIRFVLNYKRLPYKTEWVEYPDIEPVSKEHDIKPTGTKPDGSPYYTFPAIYDDATGVYLADSIPIAKYLDETYPETPTVIPAGTEILTNAFIDAFTSKMMGPFVPVVLVKMRETLNPVSAEYFGRVRAATLGKPIDELVPVGEARAKAREQYKNAMGTAKKWYDVGGGTRFVMGNKPTFVDFYVAGFFMGSKFFLGEDSDDWKDISSWQEGHWSKLLNDLKDYQAVL